MLVCVRQFEILSIAFDAWIQLDYLKENVFSEINDATKDDIYNA